MFLWAESYIVGDNEVKHGLPIQMLGRRHSNVDKGKSKCWHRVEIQTWDAGDFWWCCISRNLPHPIHPEDNEWIVTNIITTVNYQKIVNMLIPDWPSRSCGKSRAKNCEEEENEDSCLNHPGWSVDTLKQMKRICWEVFALVSTQNNLYASINNGGAGKASGQKSLGPKYFHLFSHWIIPFQEDTNFDQNVLPPLLKSNI